MGRRTPGNVPHQLTVIVRAVEEARRVFERMNSDAIDRIVETIRIMFFVAPARILRCISGFAQMGKDLPQRSGGVAGVIQCGSSVRAVVLFGGNEVDVTVETEFPLLAEFLGRFRQSVQLSQGDTGNFGRMLEKETSHVVPLRRIDPDPGTTRQLSQGPPRLSNCLCRANRAIASSTTVSKAYTGRGAAGVMPTKSNGNAFCVSRCENGAGPR